MNRFFSTQWLELALSIWRVRVVRRITPIVCTVQPVHVTAPLIVILVCGEQFLEVGRR